MVKQIIQGLMEVSSNRRRSYGLPSRQIIVNNSHVNGSKVYSLNINLSTNGVKKMKMRKKTEMI